MFKDATITVRLSGDSKKRLQERARKNHRSLSGQVAAEIETVLTAEPANSRSGYRFLGSFQGASIPSDDDIREIRTRLWGNLADRNSERG